MSRATGSRPKKSAYAAAGVDIDSFDEAMHRAKGFIHSTKTPGVVGGVGGFGGLFKSPGKKHLLVSSMDGVGTKLEVAMLAGRHDTVGQDLVNHCVNDILVLGAKPLFFLDYLGTGKLNPATFAEIIRGFSIACKQNGCALIGGETAEMPGLYPGEAYDLVGTIVGEVRRKDVITGTEIRKGDVLIGLDSSGLHTNGYSLARHILFKKAGLKVTSKFPTLGKSVGDVLLAVHRSYLKPVMHLMKDVRIRGMAHITGGGLVDNVPRILPKHLNARFDSRAWNIPAVFQVLQELGKVDTAEMYRVFNMGIGLVIAVRPTDANAAIASLKKSGERPRIIGEIVKGQGRTDII